jgi:hypothetical protein
MLGGVREEVFQNCAMFQFWRQVRTASGQGSWGAPTEADAPLDNERPTTTYLSVTVAPAVTRFPRGIGEVPCCAGGSSLCAQLPQCPRYFLKVGIVGDHDHLTPTLGRLEQRNELVIDGFRIEILFRLVDN